MYIAVQVLSRFAKNCRGALWGITLSQFVRNGPLSASRGAAAAAGSTLLGPGWQTMAYRSFIPKMGASIYSVALLSLFAVLSWLMQPAHGYVALSPWKNGRSTFYGVGDGTPKGSPNDWVRAQSGSSPITFVSSAQGHPGRGCRRPLYRPGALVLST